MTPVIRVNEDTFVWLQAFAKPFVDTPDDALQKVLALAEEHRQCIDSGESDSPASDSLATIAEEPPKVPEPTVASERGRATRRGATRRRREPTSQVLERSGDLEPGTELALLVDQLPSLGGSLDKEDLKCTWSRRRRVVWAYDGQRYTLSALARHIRDEYDVPLPLGEINGYKFWGLATDPTKSLWEIAEEKP